MITDVVPVGKYKGQAIDVMIADAGYVDWILAQAWFVDRYASLAKMLSMGRIDEPQDTPEHNAMIARLIDRRGAMEALAWRCGVTPEWIVHPEFRQVVEPKGGDIMIYFGRISILIEAKPLMGDDYPTVIRKLKAGMSAHKDGYTCKGIVIASTIQPTNLSVDQVKRQFELSGLTLINEYEFFNQEAYWLNERKEFVDKAICGLGDDNSDCFVGALSEKIMAVHKTVSGD